MKNQAQHSLAFLFSKNPSVSCTARIGVEPHTQTIDNFLQNKNASCLIMPESEMNVSNSPNNAMTKRIADFPDGKANTIIYGKIKKDGTVYFREKDILDVLENFFFKNAVANKYKNTVKAIEQSFEKLGFSESNKKIALSNLRDATAIHQHISVADLQRAAKIVHQIQLPLSKCAIGFSQSSPLSITSEYKIVLASTLASSKLLTKDEEKRWQKFCSLYEHILKNAAVVSQSKNTPIDLQIFGMAIPSVASREVFTLIDPEKWSDVNGAPIELNPKQMNDAIFSELKTLQGTCVIELYPGKIGSTDATGTTSVFSDAHLRAMLTAAQESIDAANNAGNTLRIIFATTDKTLLARITVLHESL